MGEPPRLQIFVDAEALCRAVADRMASTIVTSVATRGACDLALAGGSTPRRAYELLAEQHGARLPWSRCHLWFGDERCVPPDHADSNYAMAKAALFDRVALPAANVHRMSGEATDREAAARAYERLLPAAFDLLLLGIGPDGHTASLFPGSEALRETVRRVVPVVGPKPPPHRLTITPPVIAAARAVVVLAAGADKRSAVASALASDRPSERDLLACPARLLRRSEWLVDRAAAAAVAEIETLSGASTSERTADDTPRRTA